MCVVVMVSTEHYDNVIIHIKTSSKKVTNKNLKGRYTQNVVLLKTCPCYN